MEMKIILLSFIVTTVDLIGLNLSEAITLSKDQIIQENFNTADGSKEAAPNEFPFQVVLNILMENSNRLLCGGVLVSDSWILTAAHCLYGAASTEVILGAHNRNSLETTQKRFNVTKSNFIIHSNYPKLWTDIAMLNLSTPIVFNDAIQSISLPCQSESERNLIGNIMLVSGWGQISDKPGSFSSKLRYTYVKIVPSEECRKQFGSYFVQNLSTIYCTTGKLGTSTCSGDSGGSAVSLTLDGKIDKLMGLVSFGAIGCCTCGHRFGFIKITSYLNWIEEKSRGHIKIPQC